MRYVFEDLIDIRAIREDRASKEMSAKRVALDQAIARVESARRELEQYRNWKIQEREQLYQQIIHCPVQMKDLDRLKEMLAELEEKEALIMGSICAAEKKIEDARLACEQAREAWRKALAKVQKLREHREIWMEEAAVEEERTQEREMEEFSVRSVGAIGDELVFD